MKQVKDFASQYCAAKSLPFSAAEMALDVVAAAVNSMFPEGASETTINHLLAEGHRHEANLLRRINIMRSHVDMGGKQTKRKAGGSTKKGSAKKRVKLRKKRNRFRLHRTSVSKRVRKLGGEILKHKADYLAGCKFVGLIIDEGNTFARRCPIYAATISCDPEFNWRIQYIGQADTEGRKDGESIFKLVKKIFFDLGLQEVWEKLYCVDTDGASVMRSTSQYTGKS